MSVEDVESFERTTPDLDNKLKDLREENGVLWSKLISDPHMNASGIVDDMRRHVVKTVAVLMEHNVNLALPKKDRTPEDILKEAGAELGSMYGAKGVATTLNFMRQVKEQVSTDTLPSVFACDDCGAIVDEDDTECPECGCVFEEDDEDDDNE